MFFSRLLWLGQCNKLNWFAACCLCVCVTPLLEMESNYFQMECELGCNVFNLHCYVAKFAIRCARSTDAMLRKCKMRTYSLRFSPIECHYCVTNTYLFKYVYLQSNAAAFVNWALGCCVVAAAAWIDGWVIAANAAKFCIFIGGNRPATAADSAVCAFSPTRAWTNFKSMKKIK